MSAKNHLSTYLKLHIINSRQKIISSLLSVGDLLEKQESIYLCNQAYFYCENVQSTAGWLMIWIHRGSVLKLLTTVGRRNVPGFSRGNISKASFSVRTRREIFFVRHVSCLELGTSNEMGYDGADCPFNFEQALIVISKRHSNLKFRRICFSWKNSPALTLHPHVASIKISAEA